MVRATGRFNRTLIEMYRSMMAHSSLPKFFGGEAISTATYILNRVPIKAIE